jgi:hypothetical protein
MRRELTVILWVTALSSLGLVLIHGNLSVGIGNVLIEGDELTPAGPSGQTTNAPSNGPNTGLELPPPNPLTRALFDIAIPPATPSAPAVVAVEAAPPVLKGIVSSEGELRAIFASPNTSQYQSAGEGETIGGFKITALLPDSVSLVSPVGTRTDLRLRGPGETP